MSPEYSHVLKQHLQNLARVIVSNSHDDSLDEPQAIKQLHERVKPYVLQCTRAHGTTELIERSIQYISYTHAFPRVNASVDAYLGMLEAIIDLALPVAVPEKDNIEFYSFLKQGIDKAIRVGSKNQ